MEIWKLDMWKPVWAAYIDVVYVEDFGLEEQPQRSGLLDGMSQLTVGLRDNTFEM